MTVAVAWHFRLIGSARWTISALVDPRSSVNGGLCHYLVVQRAVDSDYRAAATVDT
jgi:hypothetical protein